MAGPRMTGLAELPRGELAALVLLAESGLRRQQQDGQAPLIATAAACSRLALALPELAARCPSLLGACGPSIAAVVLTTAASSSASGSSGSTDTTAESANGRGRPDSAA